MNTFALLQICDSLFPIGAFSHSDGLEAATANGGVASAADLREWMAAVLEEAIGRCDAPGVRRARALTLDEEWDALAALDAELHAMRPSASARDASRAMGTRLVKTWRQIHASPLLDRLSGHAGRALTLPAAFGAVCASAAIDERPAIEGFVYTRLAATASAAMRLIAIGQHEAHTILSEALGTAGRVVDEVVAEDRAPAMFAPALDIAAMSHQYVHSRLFRS